MGSQTLPIRNKAVELTRGLVQKDYSSEAKACLEFCRDRIRYVRDIRNIETLHDPVTLLNQGAGDCDDKAILLAALLLSIGHRVRFVAVAFTPDQYSHVWAQDQVYGKWIDLEPTEPLKFGQRIPTSAGATYLYQEV